MAFARTKLASFCNCRLGIGPHPLGCRGEGSREGRVIDQASGSNYSSCIMGSHTITLSDDAYKRLKQNKTPRESFSDVVLRKVSRPPARTAGELLDRLEKYEGEELFDPGIMDRF